MFYYCKVYVKFRNVKYPSIETGQDLPSTHIELGLNDRSVGEPCRVSLDFHDLRQGDDGLLQLVNVISLATEKGKKRKGMFLYSAESSLLDRSKRLTLHPPPWQTCSFRQLGFSGKHSSHAASTCNDYSFTFPQLSITRYSFIQLGHCGQNENAQTLKR